MALFASHQLFMNFCRQSYLRCASRPHVNDKSNTCYTKNVTKWRMLWNVNEALLLQQLASQEGIYYLGVTDVPTKQTYSQLSYDQALPSWQREKLKWEDHTVFIWQFHLVRTLFPQSDQVANRSQAETAIIANGSKKYYYMHHIKISSLHRISSKLVISWQ